MRVAVLPSILYEEAEGDEWEERGRRGGCGGG